MERTTIAKLNQQVFRKFPELAGVRPVVKRESSGTGSDPRFVLTYKGKAALPGGKSIQRIVRVVATEHGQVIRMSTSR